MGVRVWVVPLKDPRISRMSDLLCTYVKYTQKKNIYIHFHSNSYIRKKKDKFSLN